MSYDDELREAIACYSLPIMPAKKKITPPVVIDPLTELQQKLACETARADTLEDERRYTAECVSNNAAYARREFAEKVYLTILPLPWNISGNVEQLVAISVKSADVMAAALAVKQEEAPKV